MKVLFDETGIRDSIKTAFDFVDSSALANVSLASLKSVPYTVFNKTELFQQFENPLSVRLRYAEVAFTSAASTVYNLALALVCTLATVVTLGQVQMLTDQMKKHWIHTALAAASVGIATVGTVSPEHGIKMNAGLVLLGGGALAKSIETGAIARLGESYQRHSAALKTATLEACGGNQRMAEGLFGDLFDALDRHLNADVQTAEDLVRAFGRIHEAAPEFFTGLLALVALQAQEQLGMTN